MNRKWTEVSLSSTAAMTSARSRQGHRSASYDFEVVVWLASELDVLLASFRRLAAAALTWFVLGTLRLLSRLTHTLCFCVVAKQQLLIAHTARVVIHTRSSDVIQ